MITFSRRANYSGPLRSDSAPSLVPLPGSERIHESPLTDVTIHDPRTRFEGVKALGVEQRPWIESFPVCPALNQYQIIHAGLAEAFAPTRIVRTHQTTTYFLACFGGRGKVLIDGQWRVCETGFASLLPAHTLNAFHALPGKPWKFCWVCYQQAPEQRGVSNATSPILARFDIAPLRSAIQGFVHECSHGAEPGLIRHWIELIHGYVLRFAQPVEEDHRLRMLWDRVSAHLADEWNLTKLALESGYSREHLRRLCRAQLGRSPMHELTNLRLRRAAELLATTPRTVESIAQEVGYQNPFVFSNAFKKWIGWRPSLYRQKKSIPLKCA